MFDVVVRHVTCRHAVVTWAATIQTRLQRRRRAAARPRQTIPPTWAPPAGYITFVSLCHNVMDDMMLHMVYLVYCLLSPCPAGCSWRRGRGGCRGGTGRGRRSWAARAAPAAAATSCQFLLQGTGEVYWGNVKYSVFIRELQVFTIMEKAPTRAFSW